MSVLLASKAQVDALSARVDGFAATSWLVAPGDNPRITAYATIGGAFRMQGARVICRKTGTLRNLYYAAGTVAAGQVKGVVYDVGAITPGSKTRLWDGTALTPPGTSRWVSLGDPTIGVTAGQHLDVAVQFASAADEYGRYTAIDSNVTAVPSAMAGTQVNGCAFRLGWTNSAAVSLVTPAVFVDSAGSSSVGVPIIIAEIV